MHVTLQRRTPRALAVLFVTFVGLLALLPVTQVSAAPSATKVCTLTGSNVYTCTYSITPSVATGPGPWSVQMVPGPGTFTGVSTVVSASGCTNAPTVGAGSFISTPSGTADYDVVIGSGGCTATATVVVTETVTVTASGQVCQRVWVTAGFAPVTTCATVVFTPATSTPTPTAVKSCTLTSTPNVYTCLFTITPSVAALPGDQWLVQMVSPGPGTFTAPPPVVNASTTGCGSGPALPAVTAGTLINTTLGTADYNVAIGSAGCSAGATVVITETVAVTASGQICQRVWINAAFTPMTSCAAVVFTCSCVTGVAGMPPGGIVGSVSPSGGFGLVVFGGGTLQQLVAATGCPSSSMALWITVNGAFVIYVPGTSISAVNAAFMAVFPSGTIPAITPFLAKCA